MRKDSVVFLIVGFAAGFAILFFWTKQRETQIVKDTPLPLSAAVLGGGADGAGAGAADDPSASPPVDMAQVQQLQDRIKTDPHDYEALVQLANINFDQKNYVDGADLYKKALDIRPDDDDVRTDYGTMLFYQKRYDDAIAELNRVLARQPTHAQALFNLGVVYLHGKNDPQSALTTWEKLVATNPAFPQLEVVKQQIQALKDSLKK
jgi:cytochrome c-type biogenesis protein CcmH/NrfG